MLPLFRRTRASEDLFDLFRDFESLFRQSFGTWRQRPADLDRAVAMLPGSFTPAVNCHMKDGKTFMTMELPGVDPKDIEIDIKGNRIVIRGEKKLEKKVDEKDMFFAEIDQGRFERWFTLPEDVIADDVKATFENGLLTLVVPAAGKESVKRVPIQVATKGKEVKAA